MIDWRELLRVAICPECDGSGGNQVQTRWREYVSRDMARDAGDPAWEGMIYSEDEFEVQQCQWCADRVEALR